MQRLTASAATLCALFAAGCASKAEQHPPPEIPHQAATWTDPAGDAVDSDGNPRRGRPDVDIRRVTVDRDADRVRMTISAAAAPMGPLRYEVFAQAPEVAGYDVMSATRIGEVASGYIAFENSAARQTLTSQAFAPAGRTLAFNLPIDPILGATPFSWRITLSTAKGPTISDVMPSVRGTITFPRGG
jgi:hypothetical protein